MLETLYFQVLVIKPYLDLSPSGSVQYSYLESVVDSMAYLMHSSKFFLYCLTGAGFHRELTLLIGRWIGKTLVEDLTVTDATDLA